METGGIVFLPTQDLELTRIFYQDQLKIELALDQKTCLIFRLGGSAYVGFCQSPQSATPARSVMITILSDDLEGWYRRATEAHLICDGPPRINEQYQIEHFFIDAPDGYRVEIQRFLDPRWKNS